MALFTRSRRPVPGPPGRVSKALKPWWWGQPDFLLPPEYAARKAMVPPGEIVEAALEDTIASPPQWFSDAVKAGIPPVAPTPPRVPRLPPVPPAVRALPHSQQQAWQALHAVADAARPGLQALVLETFQQAQVAIPADLILAMQGQEQAQQAALTQAWSTAVDQHFGPKLLVQMQGLFLAGVKASQVTFAAQMHQLQTGWPDALGQQLTVEEKLPLVGNLMTPKALRWAEEHTATLLTNMNQQAQAAIRQTIQLGLARGTPIGMLTREIRGQLTSVPVLLPGMTPEEVVGWTQTAMGLTLPQVKALAKYREGLFLANTPKAKLDALVEKRANRMRRVRAETIARTETITASAAGQQALWEQAAAQGTLDPSRARRRWVLTPDDRLCETCARIPALNPDGVGLKQPFTTPDGSVMFPAAHPRCRCAVVLTFNLKETLSLPELLTPVIPVAPPTKPKVAPPPAPLPPPPPVVPTPVQTVPGATTKPTTKPKAPPTPTVAPTPATPPAPAAPAQSQTFTAGSAPPPWATTPPPTFWEQTPDVNVGKLPRMPVGKQSSGIVVIEDGKVWVYEPKNHYGGYTTAFPKGTLEKGLTAQQNALKEVWEEAGLQAEITGFLGDFKATTGTTRLYLGKRIGGNPTQFGDETWSVKLLTPADLEQAFKEQGQSYPLQALQALNTKGFLTPGGALPSSPPPDRGPGQAPAAAGQLPPVAPLPFDVATATFKQRMGGSTGAALYTGSDGIDRVVKQPKHALQGYTEALANRAYSDLGVSAPESTLLTAPDGAVQGIGNRFVAGGRLLKDVPLTQETAREVLKGYVGDVWLSNWDAVGVDMDNVMLVGGTAMRLDQGGSLLFRAQGALKTPAALGHLTEWDNFRNPAINRSYARVFEAANLSATEERALFRQQILDLQALRQRSNDFADLLPRVGGVSEAQRAEILRVMRHRATLLDTRLAELAEVAAPSGDLQARMKQLMGHRYSDFLHRVSQRPGGTMKKYSALADEEKVGVYAYSTSDSQFSYEQMNRSYWRGEDATEQAQLDALRQRMEPLTTAADQALKKLVAQGAGVRGEILYRGSRALPDSIRQGYVPGNIIAFEGFASSSRKESVAWGFGRDYHYVIEATGGAPSIKPLSAYGTEEEILYSLGAQFLVTNVEQRGQTLWVWLRDLHDTTEGGSVSKPKRRRKVAKAAPLTQDARRRRFIEHAARRVQARARGPALDADLSHDHQHMVDKSTSGDLTVKVVGRAPQWMLDRFGVVLDPDA